MKENSHTEKSQTYRNLKASTIQTAAWAKNRSNLFHSRRGVGGVQQPQWTKSNSANSILTQWLIVQRSKGTKLSPKMKRMHPTSSNDFIWLESNNTQTDSGAVSGHNCGHTAVPYCVDIILILGAVGKCIVLTLCTHCPPTHALPQSCDVYQTGWRHMGNSTHSSVHPEKETSQVGACGKQL